MYSYLDQLKVVEKVRIRDGQTARTNCPFCGGRNTFTISRNGREYVWNCYKASCGVSGGKDFLKRNGGPRRLYYKSNGQLDRLKTKEQNVDY